MPDKHISQFPGLRDSPLGHVPVNWEISHLGQFLISIDAGKSPDCPDIPAPAGEWGILKVSAVRPGGFRPEENKAITNPAHINSAYEVHDGDLLISRANTYELVGLVCLVQNAPPHLLLCDKTLRLNVDTRNALVKLVFYTMQMPSVRSQIEINATGSSGSMKNISQETIKGLLIPLPPLPEQRRIADILDTVDAAIQQTEALIAKLKLMKAGLLHDLLTRGLDEQGHLRDPDAHPEQFKDSPLGRIPREWEVQTLGQALSSIDAGKSPDCPDKPAAAGEWGILKVSAVRPEGFRAEENKAILNPAYINPAYEVHNGDLLISRANTYELVGLVCFVQNAPSRLLLCDKTLRLNIDPKDALVEFVFHVMQMSFARSQIEINATGSSGSMKNISQGTIRGLLLPFPSINQQRRIIKALDAHDARLRAEEAYCDKLKQLKQGLMRDLLTGRVRAQAEAGA